MHNQKEFAPRIALYKVNGGIIGLYPEYPILDDLTRLVSELPGIKGVKHKGWREKIQADFMTPESVLPVIVKLKTPFDEDKFKAYKGENDRFGEARSKLRDGGLSDHFREALEYRVAYHKSALPVKSVAREVTMARAAAIEYRTTYGEQLSIEQAVGFAIDRDGRKWSFYERILDEIDMSKLPEPQASSLQEAGKKFIQVMDQRLLALGIDTPDLTRQWLKNIMICGDPENPRFVLIDTEDWERVPPTVK